jgi:hypothetical protein
MAEREFLQFLEEAVQPEAVRDRRVDVDRLARDARPLRGMHRIERAHVVQAVGELDQDDPDIASHRQHHLAEVLGLRVFLALELDAVELRDTIDEVGHHRDRTCRRSRPS